MKLTDLEPVWLSDDVFIFKNPTGGEFWLTCSRVNMSISDQLVLFDDKAPEHIERNLIVPSSNYAWKFKGDDFNSLSVTPSINAEASGNWHGHITKGEIK